MYLFDIKSKEKKKKSNQNVNKTLDNKHNEMVQYFKQLQESLPEKKKIYDKLENELDIILKFYDSSAQEGNMSNSLGKTLKILEERINNEMQDSKTLDPEWVNVVSTKKKNELFLLKKSKEYEIAELKKDIEAIENKYEEKEYYIKVGDILFNYYNIFTPYDDETNDTDGNNFNDTENNFENSSDNEELNNSSFDDCESNSDGDSDFIDNTSSSSKIKKDVNLENFMFCDSRNPKEVSSNAQGALDSPPQKNCGKNMSTKQQAENRKQGKIAYTNNIDLVNMESQRISQENNKPGKNHLSQYPYDSVASSSQSNAGSQKNDLLDCVSKEKSPAQQVPKAERDPKAEKDQTKNTFSSLWQTEHGHMNNPNAATKKNPQLTMFDFFNMQVINPSVMQSSVMNIDDEKLVQKDIMSFFESSNSGKNMDQGGQKFNQKSVLHSKYMQEIQKYYNPELKKVNLSICPECGIERTMMVTEGIMVCQQCCFMDKIIVDSERPSFREPPPEISYFAYKRINHFNEWLNQFQAKESSEIPSEVFDQIILELKKEKNLNLRNLKKSRVREILSKLKLNRFYEHVSHIIYKINGIPPPSIPNDLEEILRNMFRSIQGPFMKVCPEIAKKRKNFLSYSYVLHKFLELLGYDELKKQFPLLKSREKLHRQDKIWQGICKDLGWQFIRSI